MILRILRKASFVSPCISKSSPYLSLFDIHRPSAIRIADPAFVPAFLISAPRFPLMETCRLPSCPCPGKNGEHSKPAPTPIPMRQLTSHTSDDGEPMPIRPFEVLGPEGWIAVGFSILKRFSVCDEVAVLGFDSY